MTVYKGFSTILNKKRYSVTDYALARQDLINYFNIRKGSKLMQPGFGTIIWTQLFEPLSETTQDIITNDIKKIVGYDPRLSITNIAVTQQSNGLQISLSLMYIPTNQVDTIELNFNKTNATLTTN